MKHSFSPIVCPKLKPGTHLARRLNKLSLKLAFVMGVVLWGCLLFYAVAAQSRSISDQLGWMVQENSPCGGYYRDSLFPYTIPMSRDRRSLTQLSASRAHLTLEGTSCLSGPVAIDQPGRFLLADEGYFYRDLRTGRISYIDLRGHVRLHTEAMLVISQRAHLQLASHRGYLTNILYRLLGSHERRLFNQVRPLNAWGQAARAEQAGPGRLHLWRATYTTCAPVDPIWQLAADEIVLDRTTGRGQVYKSWLYYAGVPIFYIPYLNFPIDKRRQSGFLFPAIEGSTRTGVSLSFPYYWNIAPNYDALITPVWFSERGWQLNGQFRYLTPSSHGELKVSYLPCDKHLLAFWAETSASQQQIARSVTRDRKLLIWQDETNWSPRWTSEINLNWVGDDDYLADFNNPPVLLTNQLQQQASLAYQGDHWNFLARLNHYQTLHPFGSLATNNPYNSLPSIELNSEAQQFYGIDYQVSNQLVYFQRLSNLGEKQVPPKAVRFNSQLSFSRPIIRAGGYWTPRLQLNMSYYHIRDPWAGYPSAIQRLVPQFSIDSGLYFDKSLHWRGKDYRQTLEPRLFYLCVPYRDQSKIPVFDSALIPFSYDSLFLNNRFSGYDRIGDANQVSIGVSTRILDKNSGAEKFRASLGQIYYFRDRRVNLCNSLNQQGLNSVACVNPLVTPGLTSSTSQLSPLAGQLSYQWTPEWSSSASIAWGLSHGDTMTATLDIHYQPQPDWLFNVNYSRIRLGDQVLALPTTPVVSTSHELNYLGFSFAWPLKQPWSTVGGWNYALDRHYSPSFFYGLQYDSCCWALRIVAARSADRLDQMGNPLFNKAIYFQWQLKGLSTVGVRDVGKFLTNNISGYQDSLAPRF